MTGRFTMRFYARIAAIADAGSELRAVSYPTRATPAAKSENGSDDSILWD
jgi:hypothetical protein